MNYGEIIKSAWQATWRYRAMWLLGMAVLGGCNYGSLVRVPIESWSDSSTSTNSTDYNTQQIQDALQDLVQQYWVLVVLLIICLILLVIVAYVCHYIAVGGLYQGAAWAKQGQPVKFGAMCKAGTQAFWRVFGATLCIGLCIAIPMAFYIGIAVVLAITLVGLIVAIPMLILLVVASLPLGWAMFSILSFSIQGIVLEELTIISAIKQAWKLWRAHLKDTALIYAATLLWNLLVGIVLLFFVGLVAVPLVLFGYFAYSSQAWLALGLVILIGLLLILVISIILKGISQSFIAHLWHRLYAGIAQRRDSSAGRATVL